MVEHIPHSAKSATAMTNISNLLIGNKYDAYSAICQIQELSASFFVSFYSIS